VKINMRIEGSLTGKVNRQLGFAVTKVLVSE
jgi:hypothetical protein